ncbi:ATP-grasp domain-containing protein [Candidatus Woesebacteria bacterium]|nr:ATP-grasp domain-containing protein [Candidatus Woesebacteria bacterium]
MPKKNSNTLVAEDTQIGNKTLLIVSTGQETNRFIFQQLKTIPNLTLIVIEKEKNWASQYVQDWVFVDMMTEDQIRQKIKRHYNNQIDGMVTFNQNFALLTLKLAEEFGLRGISYAAAKLLTDKFALRQFTQQVSRLNSSLIVPNYYKFTEVESAQFPAVIRPNYATTNSFVSMVNNAEELSDVANMFRRDNLKIDRQLLIEDFVDGDEVDIDICIQNGKVKLWSVSDHLSSDEPFFSEIGLNTPSLMPIELLKQARQTIELLLEQAGVINGVLHVEVVINQQGVIPISVKPLASTDESYFATKLAWGVDLIKLMVDSVLGNYIKPTVNLENPKQFVSARKLVAKKSGVLSSLQHPKVWDKSLQVQYFGTYKEVGDTILTPPNGFEPIATIVCSGTNSNDAEENVEEALNQVEYEIIPFSSVSAVGRTKRSTPFSSARLSTESIRSQARIAKLKSLPKSQQRQLVVGVACNSFTDIDGTVESELANVGNNIQQTLNQIGYQTTYIDFNNLNQAINTLQTEKIDLIFNVCERMNNSSLLEPHVASIFDAFQIPYTGSNPTTLGVCIDKIRVKKLLNFHNIPTPKWDYLYDEQDDLRTDLQFPLIVKPAVTDNSIGIDQSSVVTNQKQLKERIHYVMHQLHSPALIEEYLPGDEFDVSILGSCDAQLEALPLSRVAFDKFPRDLWHIRSFEYKFTDGGSENQLVEVQRPPKNISKKLTSLITEMALDTFMILQANDYARVDVKLDAAGNPHVLELNPNPSINQGDCVPSVAKVKGIEYSELLETIITSAVNRYRNFPAYHHLQPVLR